VRDSRDLLTAVTPLRLLQIGGDIFVKSLRDDIARVDRRTEADRRSDDRRMKTVPVDVERRSGKDRREKGFRRRQIDPTTCERDYTDDEIEFMKAIDRYRRENGRPFPTWSEVLEVVRALGYEKTGSGQSDQSAMTESDASIVSEQGDPETDDHLMPNETDGLSM
jgi:hypothetical protein